MASISFALTTKEFLSGSKTVTRRDWPDSYLSKWQKWYDEGRTVHTAWDKVPYAGGKRIGHIPALVSPLQGGMVDTIEDFCKLIGKRPSDSVAVIRFIKL